MNFHVVQAAGDAASVPAQARKLRAERDGDVCVAGVVQADGRIMDWLETEHASGWLWTLGLVGSEETFAAATESAMVQGYVAADAAILARWNGAGPLPLLSWGELPPASARTAARQEPLGLYAIVDSAARMRQVLAAGVRTVQLRMKAPESQAQLREEMQQCIADCAAAGAELFVNDHWQLAHELGARGVHLGQSDLLALGDEGRAQVLATGMALGVSSHALWELCRARALAPRYIACGPVWPTTTKDMPWLPQGPDNLAWWCAHAGAPVTAIGGILAAGQVQEAARSGADGVCIVRGLGDDPRAVVPGLQAALEAGWARRNELRAPQWPHPSLP
ncbi:thiamine phosphate synthase [Ramlibacter sp. XY19]|uniref:thiamine phosphate synthase n=1 Tax=Ramlibacter paludis TaxID=2908000 RepID=UPI0023DB4F15|nr:thiamine phosphate synthase [Ramlibacter paludis]MCG2591559.1 thiamine phosphate synthase [Ramlibacter paludis]